MSKLFNAEGNEIPARPTLTDEMKRAGALEAANSCCMSCIDKNDADEVESFVDAIAKHYWKNVDAYDLAKNMEREGWDVDSCFVDDMEQVDGYISSVLDKAINAWGELYNPVPPFELGAELKLLGFNAAECGVIDGFFEYDPATYRVKIDGKPESDTSRRLIKFEDAKLKDA